MSRSRSHALISDALGEVIAVEVPRVSGGVSQGYDPDLAAFQRRYVRTVSYTWVMSATASWQSRCEVAWACVRRSRDAVYSCSQRRRSTKRPSSRWALDAYRRCTEG